jgi:hypothetical protein
VRKHLSSPFYCATIILCAPTAHVKDIMVTKDELLEYFRKVGRKGGQATAKKLTPEQRKASARKAAQARWAKRKD